MKATQWRVQVRLVDGGRQLLRSHMKVRNMSAMDLAIACGDRRYRSSIAHLISGGRNGCSEELAAKITKVILGDTAHDTPLFAPRVYRVVRDGATIERGAA